MVIFANAQEAKGVLSAAKRAKVHGEFTWITSDGLSSLSSLSGMEDIALGAFMVKMYSVQVDDFDSYFTNLNPHHSTNPWFHRFWEKSFGCSLSRESACSQSDCISSESNACLGSENLAMNYKQDSRVGLFIDAVNTLAHGIQGTIENNCPEAFIKHEQLKSCLKGDILNKYLRMVSFDGVSGKVKFNNNDMFVAKYVVNQVTMDSAGRYQLTPAALWDIETGITVWQNRIQWVVQQQTNFNQPSDKVPESVCSHPCGVGYATIKQEVHCCWVCHKCRENEIVHDNTLCKSCPNAMWPDNNRLYCENIEKTFLSFSHLYAILIVAMSVFGILSFLAIVAVFIRNRNKKLIKALSRELSFIILLGLLISYLTIFTLVVRPTNGICTLSRVCFHVSFTLIYAPLLIKTNRISRIFEAGRKGNTRPHFIGNTIQVIFTLVLISIQVSYQVLHLYKQYTTSMKSLAALIESSYKKNRCRQLCLEHRNKSKLGMGVGLGGRVLR